MDEAVFALGSQTVDLAGQLYGSIYHPYVRQAVSYRAYDESGKAIPNTAGAEGAADTGGGGAGAYLRREFLDTAAFQTAQLGADGKAVLSVKLPDNVTSWRVTALAVTPDLKAAASPPGGGDTALLPERRRDRQLPRGGRPLDVGDRRGHRHPSRGTPSPTRRSSLMGRARRSTG